jgi:hypothetical protein
MKHELIECIVSHEAFVDLNDEHVFKNFKLSDLVTESKTVLYFPDFLLQVPNREQLINLLNVAIYVRNVSFFTLVLFYLRRCSVHLEYNGQDGKVMKITGPWREAILYVIGRKSNPHYERVFARQFFDLNQHAALPLPAFVEVLCENFTKYQRFADGQYQIVPTAKQKAFLQRIICAEECFHFSEVGSGKTKVILPLLCQLFLSNNAAAHGHFARGGKAKDVLVILVPEHLVPDARAQVFRYCLNLNFRTEYRLYDDIFALLHDDVVLGRLVQGKPMKQVFVTSFNSFKKALTYDAVCAKVGPHREHVLVVADEVDDFLDRDKLVFNICSNKGNAFDRATLERYFEVSRAAYHGAPTCPEVAFEGAANPAYWRQLFDKCGAIHAEIQDASRSLNKSFGIFNAQTLRHCASNIAHDVEGYKSLIARPYESVNRAMPGSYYSDVERTVYLTFVVLNEDVAKYDELFQQERKFVSFEYWKLHLKPMDYDDLVYGHEQLSELVAKHPACQDGMVRFLYEIILRRMEIRDQSRSVNSIDVVFNFDAIGFTGTPFIDNYPTFAYIRNAREDAIPDMIDRSFYAYSSDTLSDAEFQARFAAFQGQNSNVLVEYVASDFVAKQQHDELAILVHIFNREKAAALRTAAVAQWSNHAQMVDARGSGGARGVQLALQQAGSASSVADVDKSLAPSSPPPVPLAVVASAASAASAAGAAATAAAAAPFNVLVDLCGVFKRSSIHQVRDTIKAQQLSCDGATTHGFHYVYHIGPADGSDRVLSMHSDNDVVFDEEFFKHLCKTYGAQLRDRVFFFVDNRNVIGKDIPFQLVYQRRFGQPLFTKSIVLAHDVDDFSKIWQAMGRSRTMNDTHFAIYKSGVVDMPEVGSNGGSEPLPALRDIKSHALTRLLYVQNCDRKHAGNLSSIYQTLISLMNLAKRKFYHTDEIVNTFLEKLEMTIGGKVAKHAGRLAQHVLGAPLPAKILAHLLESKFRRSTNAVVAAEPLTPALVNTLLRQVKKG